MHLRSNQQELTPAGLDKTSSLHWVNSVRKLKTESSGIVSQMAGAHMPLF
jgi:hypothetical protein